MDTLASSLLEHTSVHTNSTLYKYQQLYRQQTLQHAITSVWLLSTTEIDKSEPTELYKISEANQVHAAPIQVKPRPTSQVRLKS